MKQKKLFALLASLSFVCSCGSLPVSAENTSDLVVVGVNKDNTGYVVRGYMDFSIGKNQLEKYNSSIGDIQLGDILTFENLNWNDLKEYGGIHSFSELLEDVDEDTVTVSVAGSVFDNPEMKTYKVWGFSIDEITNEWNDSVNHFLVCSLADEKGSNPFTFFGETDNYIYTAPECTDWTALQTGDIVSCITYQNSVAFIAEKLSVTPVGDIDADDSITSYTDELTLTEAYNKLDAILYPDGIGWRKLAPLDECLEMEHIVYYYHYYESEICDEIRKICEKNGIDTNLLEFCVLESAEEQETSIETLLEGDADGNSKIDILDVITLNKAVMGKENLTASQLKAIDFNGNSQPDSEEVLTILKYIVGLVTSFTA